MTGKKSIRRPVWQGHLDLVYRLPRPPIVKDRSGLWVFWLILIISTLTRGLMLKTEWLRYEVNQMIRMAVDLVPDVNRVVIRLYGGWMENGVLTQRGSALQQVIAGVDPFPLPLPHGRGLLRGEIVLATRLFSLASVEWGHTSKTREGLPKLRLAADIAAEICPEDRTTCPVKAFAHFSKKLEKTCHIAACTATNRRTFVRQEQKMVDTMIACDILTIPRENEVARLLVLSEDTDLLPPIAVTAGAYEFPISLILPRERKDDPYAAILAGLGVTLITWEL